MAGRRPAGYGLRDVTRCLAAIVFRSTKMFGAIACLPSRGYGNAVGGGGNIINIFKRRRQCPLPFCGAYDGSKLRMNAIGKAAGGIAVGGQYHVLHGCCRGMGQ